jgi:ApaG protein
MYTVKTSIDLSKYITSIDMLYSVCVCVCIGTDMVRVNGRHWVFCDANKKMQIVPRHSAGVLGQTPVIEPGRTFEYASGCDVETPSAVAYGCLHLTRYTSAGEETFDAAIAPFSLRSTVED